MKTMIALAAIAGLLLAPAAYAQVTCSELSRVNSEAKDDFDGLVGSELDEDIYQATYTLSGSSGCTLDYTWDSIYSCEYQFADFSAASNARNTFAATIIGCFPGWQVESVTPDATPIDGYRTMMGTRYAGNGVDSDLEWVSVLEEHTDGNGKHYHVWVELAYYW